MTALQEYNRSSSRKFSWRKLSFTKWLTSRRQGSWKQGCNYEDEVDEDDDEVDAFDDTDSEQDDLGVWDFEVDHTAARYSCCSAGDFQLHRSFSTGLNQPRYSSSGLALVPKHCEILQAKFTDIQHLRVFVGTWNVGGRPPDDKLVMEDWLGSLEEPADIYVVGFQEVVPLSAGNILQGGRTSSRGGDGEKPLLQYPSKKKKTKQKNKVGSCCSAAAARWQDLIHQTLNYNSSSAKFAAALEQPLRNTKSIHNHSLGSANNGSLDSCSNSYPRFSRSCSSFHGCTTALAAGRNATESGHSPTVGITEGGARLARSTSTAAPPALCRQWPVPTLDAPPPACQLCAGAAGEARGLPTVAFQRLAASHLGAHAPLVRSTSTALPCPCQLRGCVSDVDGGGTCGYSPPPPPTAASSCGNSPPPSPPPLFTMVASEQMVGLFVSVWVKSHLRRCVRNVKVSCIGCGLMGYLGNKGSISVSMCVHETTFCFVCSHLASGEKDGDEIKRNSDVAHILNRTHFRHRSATNTSAISGAASLSNCLPQTILEHDRVIWLGDLNYRLALSAQVTRLLLAREDWDALLEKDQLHIQRRAGRVFKGWKEGKIYFAPTYKYRENSDSYTLERRGSKLGNKKRTPAWCDRILWYGSGLTQLAYVRAETKFSDHRPVYALFSAEVEVLSKHKLKDFLLLKSAKVQVEELLPPSFSNIHDSYPRKSCRA